ncbi:MAG: UDP-galactopyranose mutase [Idiomarina sp.]|uniref:protoporphyrinogen/coproporphyrinogen oxidase n=1 Tax=Idiomarina sp. TaxID=1874361 RepID=UPI000C4DA2CF|nr:NAD(P)-binding protein [Idiomarina sp.]MBT42235.1 UDP-galactopyranose mutase [Idiomarina sp.]
MKVLIIGAGISGLSVANLLSERKGISADIWESNKKPGGLIECDVVRGFLYHKVGGHVFNSKKTDVLNWFWGKFDKENEFVKVDRNAKILLQNKLVGYPLENHLYQLDRKLASQVVKDLISASKNDKVEKNFKEFLLNTFGRTLCDMYFFPYNEKIWQCNLEKVSLEWLEGKLPTPDLEKIIVDNIFKKKEDEMVHSTFFYPVKGGSQFIANRLSEGLNIEYGLTVDSIQIHPHGVIVNNEFYEKLIFTGDVRELNFIIEGLSESAYSAVKNVTSLLSHGTSNILCECDPTDLSWLYIPESFTRAHRIIYTGNFSKFNNTNSQRSSCTVEFSGKLTEDEMINELDKLPGNLVPLSSNHQKSSYVIHESKTKKSVETVKSELAKHNVLLLGRFAEWEYFNMDTAIASAMSLVENEF